MKRLFCPISKVEDAGDGTIKVWGWASTGARDDDGEIILPEAIKAALPDYLKWGAVREMHQPKAVGTAIEAEVQDDGRTWFGAHVVDPVAVKKVQNKVLKGFSVGGRITGRDDVEKTTITGINLIEVSLVDRPANPECEIVIAKAAAADAAYVDDLAELVTAGQVDVRALLKAAQGLAKAPVATTPPAEPESLAKGLYNLRDFAQALECLAWVAMSAEYERDAEGDASPVPAQLRAWMKAGAEIFKAMATEEIDELIQSLQEQAGEVIELMAKGDTMNLNLSKAKMSKDMAAKMQALSDHHDKMVKCAKDLHGMTKEACEMMKAMMPDDDDGNNDGKGDKAAHGDDLAKGGDAPAPAAAAPSAGDDAAANAAALAEVIKGAVAAAVAPLRADMDKIKSQPAGGVPYASAAAALAAKGIMAVDRSADLSGAEPPSIAPVRTASGKIDEGATVTKALLDPSRAIRSN
jgi:hypothetical protein